MHYARLLVFRLGAGLETEKIVGVGVGYLLLVSVFENIIYLFIGSSFE